MKKLVSGWRFLDGFFEKSVMVRAVKVEVFLTSVLLVLLINDLLAKDPFYFEALLVIER